MFKLKKIAVTTAIGLISFFFLGNGSESESDASFGDGVDFKLTSNLKINAEYINYLGKDGAEISDFTVGLSNHF